MAAPPALVAATPAFAKHRPEKRAPAALAATPKDRSVGCCAPDVESTALSDARAEPVSLCAPPAAKAYTVTFAVASPYVTSMRRLVTGEDVAGE